MDAREQSIAGDPRPGDVLNRTYQGKTVKVTNESDLDLVLDTRRKMNDKPVIFILKLSNPTVLSEFEPEVDAILVDFRIQIPADMSTVEKQFEDVPFDMTPYRDSEGNRYVFAFGLNWQGVIRDERTGRYGKQEE